MSTKTLQLDTSSTTYTAVGAGAGQFAIFSNDAGYALDGIYRKHQITISGLDGAAVGCQIYPAGDLVSAPNDYGPASFGEADTLLVTDVVAGGIVLDITGGGGSYAPIVTITSIMQGL